MAWWREHLTSTDLIADQASSSAVVCRGCLCGSWPPIHITVVGNLVQSSNSILGASPLFDPSEDRPFQHMLILHARRYHLRLLNPTGATS